MQGMGMMVSPNTQTTKMPMQEKINTAIVDGSQFREAVANLSAESSDVLEQHLTPRVKEAMAELFGPEVIEVLKDFGLGHGSFPLVDEYIMALKRGRVTP